VPAIKYKQRRGKWRAFSDEKPIGDRFVSRSACVRHSRAYSDDLGESRQIIRVKLTSATDRENRLYNAELNRQIRRVDRLEDRQVRKVLGMLRRARTNITNRIGSASDFDALHLRGMKAEVSRVLDEFRATYANEFPDLLFDIEDAATDMVKLPLSRLGVEVNLPVISSEITDTLADFHAGQIKNVSEDAINKINIQLTTGVLGGSTRSEILKSIGRVLPDAAGAGSIGNRAERIVRTEVNRMHAQMTQRRLEQAVETVPNLRKWWMTAGDGRVRQSHARASIDYGEFNPIPVNQPFSLNGYPAMFPRDPRLPAAEVVNCRCRHVPVVIDEQKAAEPTFEPQKTTLKAQEWGKRNHLAIEEYVLAGMDVASANQVNRAMWDMVHRDGLPSPRSVKFYSQRPSKVDVSTLADASPHRFKPHDSAGDIRIFSGTNNTMEARFTSSREAYARSARDQATNRKYLEQAVKDGTADAWQKRTLKWYKTHPIAERFSVYKNPYELMIHEYGHIVHGLMKPDVEIDLVPMKGTRSGYKVLGGTSSRWKQALDKKIGAKGKRVATEISQYASTNTAEHFAEAWTAIQLGEGKLVSKAVREFVKEVKDNAIRVAEETGQ